VKTDGLDVGRRLPQGSEMRSTEEMDCLQYWSLEGLRFKVRNRMTVVPKSQMFYYVKASI